MLFLLVLLIRNIILLLTFVNVFSCFSFIVETKTIPANYLDIIWNNPILNEFLQTILMIVKMMLMKKVGQMRKEKIQVILTTIP